MPFASDQSPIPSPRNFTTGAISCFTGLTCKSIKNRRSLLATILARMVMYLAQYFLYIRAVLCFFFASSLLLLLFSIIHSVDDTHVQDWGCRTCMYALYCCIMCLRSTYSNVSTCPRAYLPVHVYAWTFLSPFPWLPAFTYKKCGLRLGVDHFR